LIELYHGNVLSVLPLLSGQRFDGIITDPPYSSGGQSLSERQKATSAKYTSAKKHCPYPDFEGDTMDQRSWARFIREVLEAGRDACNPGAVCALFVDWRQLPALTDALQWAGWVWRGTAVWDKVSSRPQKGRYRQQTEFIVWGSNGALPMNRPVPVLPGLFRAPNVPTERRMHQTQKPIDVMRQVVQIVVPGGHILDPFVGSGTTLEAARLEGYDATGVELSHVIAKMAAARLGVDVLHAGKIPIPSAK
jgi:site-specific DNA-methyltransferase (adenine-specific)